MKTLGNGEIARNEQFLLFQRVFLPLWRTLYHFHQIQIRLQTLSVWKCLKFVFWERVKREKKTELIFLSTTPITRRHILDSSKLKDFADDNFEVDENGRKVSKWVEDTVVKGEIARDEQFLLFPQCFQNACFPGASKCVIVWEWVNKN